MTDRHMWAAVLFSVFGVLCHAYGTILRCGNSRRCKGKWNPLEFGVTIRVVVISSGALADLVR